MTNYSDLIEGVIVLIKHEGDYNWYISYKEDWMLSEILNEQTIDAFISQIEKKKHSTQFLQALFSDFLSEIKAVEDLFFLFPKIFIDFDDKYFSIRIEEDYRSYEDFIPEDWTQDHNDNLPNYIPQASTYWIIDKKDYFLQYTASIGLG